MKANRLKIPPAIIGVLLAACMWRVSKLCIFSTVALPLREIIALAFSIAGLILIVLGGVTFGLAKTTVNPLKFESVSSLVVSGIYSITRNPMYLGGLFILLGWSYFLSNLFSFIFVPVFVLYMNYFQIRFEELALESKFGQDFISYKSKVRRWI